MSNLEYLIRKMIDSIGRLRFRNLAGESPTLPSLVGAKRTPTTTLDFTFQFPSRRRKYARVFAHTHETIESALRERRSDRAIAPCTVTRAYTFGARGPPPLSLRDHHRRAFSSLYIGIALPAESNPRFRIPSSTLSGEALPLVPSARPIFYELPVSGPRF